MQLSPRLKLIADLVKEGSVVADIGTDHGYIPVYCVKNGISPSAIAMDVNPMPLAKAEENIALYGLEDSITTRLSNGLEALKKDEADTVVIAGMGGLLMINILSEGICAISEKTHLILQPMIAQRELRGYLYENGFVIDGEYVCREENKFYNIICARMGSGAQVSDKDIFVGRDIDKNTPDVYMEYLDYKIGVCTKIINGMKKSKSVNTQELSFAEKELDIFVKERKCFCES